MSRNRAVRLVLALTAFLLVLPVCGGGGGGGGGGPGQGQREFRAIAGVSMGAYGALNLGTKHQDTFGTIGALGGPVDLWQLLTYVRDDNLEVKPSADITGPDDFTFDLLPPYPDRGTRITFTKDLVLAFGNPLLHHPDPDFAYLAIDSQPAAIGMDDEWGPLTLSPAVDANFADGGDANENGVREVGELPDETTDALLVAYGSLDSVLGIAGGDDVGGRMLADAQGNDAVYDIGDGIVVNLSESFTDANGSGRWDPGEPFDDFGLDGVGGTSDFGEGNGVFDEDPDIATWLVQDPTSRLAAMSADDIRRQRIYMDVGDSDELGFYQHYMNLLDVFADKGIAVDVIDGYDGNCLTPPDVGAPYTLLVYEGGHVGFDTDELLDDLENGDVCGTTAIWQRLIHMLVAMDAAFPDGVDRPQGFETGEAVVREVPSPALAAVGGDAPLRTVVAYRPPAYYNTTFNLPVVYFLGGHGQKPEDYERIDVLMDLLIATGTIQNMFLVFLPGEGGTEGSFYANHVVGEDQVPGLSPVTSGRYEDSILDDLIPTIEANILNNRVR